MKKLISILVVLVILAGMAFAEASATLNITATITPVAPTYTLKGTFNSNYTSDTKTADTEAQSSTNTLAFSGDITTTPINVYISVYQTAASRYSKPEGVSISVQANPLKLDGTSDTYKSTPTIVTSAGGAATTTDFNSETHTENSSSVTVSFLPKYLTGAPVAADTLIGKAQFQYPAVSTLPAGNYSATVVITYTAN